MTGIDPSHPVIVGAHELAVRTADAEPVAMMVDAARAAFADCAADIASRIDTVRVVKGIWPYADPGRLVAAQLGLDRVTTALTGIGGNATYDLVAATAVDIANGDIDVALVCGAESMRTRRKDRAEGRRSAYLTEPDGARPDRMIAADSIMADGLDTAAMVDHPVNYYALAESVIRHRRNESLEEHRSRISALWAEGSAVAASNPHAWIDTEHTASQIATVGPSNRLVASPYTKLMTSNINVDQGAALVMCSHRIAKEFGVPPSHMVFLEAATGGVDHLPIRTRLDLDRSPAFRLSAHRALTLADRSIDEVTHLDLYSCFPASVQLARTELELGADRPFTITGGLTFAGGPFNGYCTQALAHAVPLLRGTDHTAFLYGNGGYFSKHSVLLMSGTAPVRPFRHERVDDAVSTLPRRVAVESAPSGTVEAYTVIHDRGGQPLRGIVSVLDDDGGRFWGTTDDPSMLAVLLEKDVVGARLGTAESAEAGQVAVVTFV